MASYGIFRVEKLKKIANLVKSLKHAFREQDTPNADSSKLGDNELLTPDAHNVDTTMKKYERLKPQGKIRSDVVHAIEVLVTASPEKIKSMTDNEKKAFFDDALKFCNTEFGEGNLLHAQIHNDETTGHLTAFYIPVIEKTNKRGEVSRKLNASALLGGKKDYSERQTRFHKNVGEKYGLERGEIGSKATHKKVLDWYKEVNLERVGDDFESVMEAKAFDNVKVNVDEAKPAMLGLRHTVETVEKTVSLNFPVVPLPYIKEALKPRMNGNSEMKRREKEAWKKEVRKEVEEEAKAKFLIKEAKLLEQEAKIKEREKTACNVIGNVEVFYNTVADKLGVSVKGKSFPETRKAIIDKAEENGNLARKSIEAVEFKKSVDEEVATWVYSASGNRVYSNFEDYKQAFRAKNDKIESLTKDINRLTGDKEHLSNELSSANREKSLLISIQDKISGLVRNFFDGTLEKTIEKLVNIAKKFSDPDFIKSKYKEICQQKFDDNRELLQKHLDYVLDYKQSTTERIKTFQTVSGILRGILDYSDNQPPDDFEDIFNKYEKAREEVEKLVNRPRMRM